MKRNSVVLLGFSVLVLASCDTSGGPSTPTTPTTPGATSSTQVLSGTLTPGGPVFHGFSLPNTLPIHITLGSLTNSAGMPLGSTVTLKFGVESAAGSSVCDALVSASVTAALKAQINATVSSGVYCVSLTDTSGVPTTANYSIRIVYGTPSDASSSGTISYSSSVLPGGFTTRGFAVAAAGVAAITMDSFSPASAGSIGLGVGIQRNDGSGCELSTAISATPGGQLSVPIDPGLYCVKVFDAGTLTGQTTFALRILHP
jgi:hypothetical protein